MRTQATIDDVPGLNLKNSLSTSSLLQSKKSLYVIYKSFSAMLKDIILYIEKTSYYIFI